MRLLGIDYGRKKIGFAIAESKLASPLKVMSVDSLEDAVEKVVQVVQVEQVGQVVVGISEGKMAEETRGFGMKLKENLGTPVVYQDETLSSKDAQRLSFEAGVKRKKRKNMEHAYSATILLQNYLDKSNS